MVGHGRDEEKTVKSHKHSCRPNMELVGKISFLGPKHDSKGRAEVKIPMPGTVREGSGIPGWDLPMARTARVM